MPGTISHISNRIVQVVVGVDTHKDQHVAVAIDGRGVRLDEKHVAVAVCGYEELERWSGDLGHVRAFGIEGTGSYGAGLARFLTCRDYTVVEVNRSDRSVRYRKGKSDPTDAEMAADHGDELIRHPALVLPRCISVPDAYSPEHFGPRYCADLSNHIRASVVWVTPIVRQ